jgi:hypothetical protein
MEPMPEGIGPMASAYQAQQEPKIDQWFRRSFVAVATSMACTEFPRQLLVECRFLDNRFVCDGHHIGRSQSLIHSHPVMPMAVLICGGPASGFKIIGLFANSADAQSYAEDYSLKDWWVAEIISPGAFAESPVATASKSHL